MITKSDIVEIGQFNRAHGIKGEINATIDPEVIPDQLQCLIVDIDGIFTPFFIESWRQKTASTILLTISGIESDAQADLLKNKPIFITQADAANFSSDDDIDGDDRFYLDDLIGYKINESTGPVLGTITDIDDSTSNVLFVVDTPENKRLLIPAVDEYIDYIDPDTKVINVILPEGFLEMQKNG
ncbi:MAG: ribosome maturation factor RimM [Muribaculaceae bacterium]|nr:ribosome maturation factor RimM [Muribaculaceae bacterium]MDE5968783.1 ribosome maturation factor RimM [Muribaculaceae bacterium]